MTGPIAIGYRFAQSPFGEIVVACTEKGICYLAFADDREEGLADLRSRFPNATGKEPAQGPSDGWSELREMPLDLNGTEFQLKVWKCLLKIPAGRLSTYGAVAKGIGHPKAFRAVGTAVGENPVAVLVPCHRVIRSDGELGNYRWGRGRKATLIGWEAAQTR